MGFGIAAGVLAIPMLIVGGVLLGAENVIQTQSPVAKGPMPGTLRFDADDARYSVLLDSRRRRSTGDSYRARCDITRADGSQAKIRGDIQVIAVEGAGQTIGEFQAKVGPTVVACRWAESATRQLSLVVAEQQKELRFAAVALLIAGGAFLLACLVLLALGAKGWAARTGGY